MSKGAERIRTEMANAHARIMDMDSRPGLEDLNYYLTARIDYCNLLAKKAHGFGKLLWREERAKAKQALEGSLDKKKRFCRDEATAASYLYIDKYPFESENKAEALRQATLEAAAWLSLRTRLSD